MVGGWIFRGGAVGFVASSASVIGMGGIGGASIGVSRIRMGGIGVVASGAVVEFFIGDDHAGHPGLAIYGEGGDLEQFGDDDAVGCVVGVHDGVDEASAWCVVEEFGERADCGEGAFGGGAGATAAVPFDFDGTGCLRWADSICGPCWCGEGEDAG